MPTINIFSPEDVTSFVALVNSNNNTANPDRSPLEDVFSAIVTKEGTFVLKFNGDASDIAHNNTNANLNLSTVDFDDFLANTDGNLESKFLRYLKNVMKIKGVELVKISKRLDKVSKIKLKAQTEKHIKGCD